MCFTKTDTLCCRNVNQVATMPVGGRGGKSGGIQSYGVRNGKIVYLFQHDIISKTTNKNKLFILIH